MNLKTKKLIISLLGISILLCSCDFSPPEYYIFKDLAECKTLENCNISDLEITSFDTPGKHQYYIKNLSYHSFYGAHYQTPAFQFDIYAFEFVTENDAQKYFKNLTGKSTVSDGTTFTSSAGMTTFELTVINKNYAYTIFSPVADKKEVVEFINAYFSILVT